MSFRTPFLALAFAALFATAFGQGGGGTCNSGCDCQCICPPGGGGGGMTPGGGPPPGGMPPGMTMCGMCPTTMPGTNMTMPTTPGMATSTCDTMIRAAAASNPDVGSVLGTLLQYLFANLVIPILSTVLFGNNTIEGAVIPLANVLCYIVGLVLLLLQRLGALGILGMGGLLGNVLGGLGRK